MYPTESELIEIARRTTGADQPAPQAVASGEQVLAMQRLARQVPVADHVSRYAARLILATHPDHTSPEAVRKNVLYGASPRGMQTLILGAKISAMLDGRSAVSLDDIRAVALPALRHRLILNYEAQAEGTPADAVVSHVLQGVAG